MCKLLSWASHDLKPYHSEGSNHGPSSDSISINNYALLFKWSIYIHLDLNSSKKLSCFVRQHQNRDYSILYKFCRSLRHPNCRHFVSKPSQLLSVYKQPRSYWLLSDWGNCWSESLSRLVSEVPYSNSNQPMHCFLDFFKLSHTNQRAS